MSNKSIYPNTYIELKSCKSKWNNLSHSERECVLETFIAENNDADFIDDLSKMGDLIVFVAHQYKTRQGGAAYNLNESITNHLLGLRDDFFLELSNEAQEEKAVEEGRQHTMIDVPTCGNKPFVVLTI